MSKIQANDIELGAEQDVRELFSHPPTVNEITSTPQLLNQTVEETIAIYVGSSLKRDGFGGEVKVLPDGGKYYLRISGPDSKSYATALPKFLDAGRTAHQISEAVKSRWQTYWRFFLPLGLALTNHRTVQLMHFPPLYVLEQAQDYLNAKTTDHWAELLVANEVPRDKTDL
jgi:hypothetical protein